MPGDYHHGARVIEVNDGARPIRTAESAIIGVVVTAPDAMPAVAASVTIGQAAANNAITLVAKTAGIGGNGISCALVNPGAANQALDVTVLGKAITVHLATGANGAITSTADEVILAIDADIEASVLVDAMDGSGSTGAGVVAAVAATKLIGGADEPFPLDTPVLVAGNRALAAKLDGAGLGRGTGPKVMKAIFDQIGAVCVVVRVAEGLNAAATTANVIGSVDPVTGQHKGLQALLTAKAKLGIKPRILGCPGLDTQAVTAATLAIADQLRAFDYFGCADSATAEAAAIYRNNFGSKRGMAIWPDFLGFDSSTSSTDTLWATARALGMRAKIDNDIGWHKTISNMPVNGVTGISKDVPWDLQDPNTVAGYLNAHDVTTIINEKGYRFWGSRTCSADPMFAFESAVRTGDILADTIADAHLWAIDLPMSKSLITDIVEGINAKFRELKALGYIVDAKAWVAQDKNDEMTLAAGKLYIAYNYTPVPPLENLNFLQSITTEYLVQLLATN